MLGLRTFASRIGSRAQSRANHYFAAIDQGTSSSRVILYDSDSLAPVASHQVDLTSATQTPEAGWAQMDAQAIVDSVDESARGALEKAGASASDVVGVGITNQRESVVVWDRATGEPLYDCVLWLDTRTRDTAAELEANLGSVDALRPVCGLPISTYFTGVKLKWMVDNLPEVKKAIEGGTACVGTVDAWLAWKLTDGAAHVTDVTNASRTMMMDLQSGQWHPESIEKLGLDPQAMANALPRIVSNAEALGAITRSNNPLKGAQLTGSIGDQQSAMVGQHCFEPGTAKTTYGTGAFTLMNVGTTPRASENGLLSTALYQMGPDDERFYALEGAVGSCAVGINWFRDSLNMIDSAPEIDALADEAADGTHGLYFVSAFGGLLAPHWRDDARGALLGLTLAHDKTHVSRAVLEGIAFQVTEVMESMEADSQSCTSMRVDGGVANSDPMLQYQADLLSIPVLRPKNLETTALGAAIVAAIGAGERDIASLVREHEEPDAEMQPVIDQDTRDQRMESWRHAVRSSCDWAGRA